MKISNGVKTVITLCILFLLGIPVSHGCVRLGVEPAEFLYNWAPIGTAVKIY